MPDPTFTEAPAEVPSRSVPSTFSALTDPFLVWEKTFRNELSSSVSWFALQATNAGDSAIATAADAEQTALDRIATAADAEQTALDRVATGEDVTETGSNLATMRAYYLGGLASDPTLDGNGNPVQDGAWYSNTTIPAPRLRRAGQWVTAVLDANGALMVANSLSDVPDKGAARTALELGSAATKNTGTTNGTIPMIGEDDKLPAGVIPEGTPSGLVPIGTKQVLSGVAATDILLTGDYDGYIIKFWGFEPATNDVALLVRTSSDSGATFDSGASDYLTNWVWYRTGTTADGGAAASSGLVAGNSATTGISSGSGYGVTGEITIPKPSVVGRRYLRGSASFFQSATLPVAGIFDTVRDASADIDTVRLYFSAGNISSGEYQLYGVVTV